MSDLKGVARKVIAFEIRALNKSIYQSHLIDMPTYKKPKVNINIVNLLIFLLIIFLAFKNY